MKLSPTPSASGRIRKILLADAVGSKDYTIDTARKRYAAIIQAFVDHGADDIEIWIYVKRNFYLCTDSDDVKVRTKSFYESEKSVSNFIEFRDSLKDELKAIFDRKGLRKKFNVEEQLKIIRPNIDFKEIGKEIVHSKLLNDGVTIADLAIGGRNNFSAWIQDPFFLLRTACNCPVILDPYYYAEGRYVDKYIAEQIASQEEIFLKPTRFFFEGGNILAGEDFILVGPDELKANMKRYCSESYASLVSYMKTDFGVNEIVFPGMDGFPCNFEEVPVQPAKIFFHLDLFLTLGGKNADGKQIIFVAELYTPDPNGKPGTFELVKVEGAEATYLCKLEKWFKNYSQGGLEFEVYRLPAVVLYEHIYRYFFSYSNCLVERCKDVNQIFVPQYQSDNKVYQRAFNLAEKAVKDVIEQEGMISNRQKFSVRMVAHKFFSISQSSGGASFHCITKVIQRS